MWSKVSGIASACDRKPSDERYLGLGFQNAVRCSDCYRGGQSEGGRSARIFREDGMGLRLASPFQGSAAGWIRLEQSVDPFTNQRVWGSGCRNMGGGASMRSGSLGCP